MKRFLILLLGAAVAISVIGCGAGEEDPDAPKSPPKLNRDANAPASNTNPGSNSPDETL